MRSNSTRENRAAHLLREQSSAPGICGWIPAGTNRRRANPKRFLRSRAARAWKRIRTARRSARLVGCENSRIATVPPGFSTRASSCSPFSVIREVAKPERDGDQIERTVRQRQRQRIRFKQRRRGIGAPTILRWASTSMGWQKSLPALTAARSSGPGFQRQQHVARSAAQVEHSRIRDSPEFRDAVPPSRPPALVQIEREQVIQQVVARGDAAEHPAHPVRRGLFAGHPRRRGAGGAGHRSPASRSCATASSDSSIERERSIESGNDLDLADLHRQHEVHLALDGLLIRAQGARTRSVACDPVERRNRPVLRIDHAIEWTPRRPTPDRPSFRPAWSRRAFRTRPLRRAGSAS